MHRYLLAALLLAACSKGPGTVRLQATGQVEDQTVHQMIPHAWVYIWGASDPVDSVQTDANGQFSLSYLAQGSSAAYTLSVLGAARLSWTYPQPDYLPVQVIPEQNGISFGRQATLTNVTLPVTLMGYIMVHVSGNNPAAYPLVGDAPLIDWLLPTSPVDTVLKGRCVPGARYLVYGGASNYLLADTVTSPNPGDTTFIHFPVTL